MTEIQVLVIDVSCLEVSSIIPASIGHWFQ